ncbi:hypothetical protein [Ectobacillus funiculus]|uniref:hypothetical protein n=1 Tax=Ectobacillus funiculus TaxID=137993 RepID=UPI00101D7D70|nr:hypothetical protein [Ectobacillus funiculus]
MHPFFSHENLISLVKPFSEELPYYRPFILHGRPEQIDLFLVGINPATAVSPEDGVDIDTWVETLMDPGLYSTRHSSNGPTRLGIQGLLRYVKTYYPYSLLETNINAFPTSRAIGLEEYSVKEAVIEGQHRFIRILTTHEPSLIILHSQHTTREFIDILVKYKWIHPRHVLKKTTIKHRETQFPHFTFTYPSGKKAKVFACRHLQYFGHEGDSFQPFLHALVPFLKEKAKIPYCPLSRDGVTGKEYMEEFRV